MDSLATAVGSRFDPSMLLCHGEQGPEPADSKLDRACRTPLIAPRAALESHPPKSSIIDCPTHTQGRLSYLSSSGVGPWHGTLTSVARHAFSVGRVGTLLSRSLRRESAPPEVRASALRCSIPTHGPSVSQYRATPCTRDRDLHAMSLLSGDEYASRTFARFGLLRRHPTPRRPLHLCQVLWPQRVQDRAEVSTEIRSVPLWRG